MTLPVAINSSIQLYRCAGDDLRTYYPIPRNCTRVYKIVITNCRLDGAKLEILSCTDQTKRTVMFKDNQCILESDLEFIYGTRKLETRGCGVLPLDTVLMRIYPLTAEYPESIQIWLFHAWTSCHRLLQLERIPNSDEHGYKLPHLYNPLRNLYCCVYDKAAITVHINGCKRELNCCHMDSGSQVYITSEMIAIAARNFGDFAKHLKPVMFGMDVEYQLSTNEDSVYISFPNAEPLYLDISLAGIPHNQI